MYQSNRTLWRLIVFGVLFTGASTQISNAQGQPCLEPCEAQDQLRQIELGQCIVDEFAACETADEAYFQAYATYRINLILAYLALQNDLENCNSPACVAAAYDTYAELIQVINETLAEAATIRDLSKEIAEEQKELCDTAANEKFSLCYPNGCGMGG